MRQKTKRLAPTDAEAYRAMRLEALKQSPEAFGSTGKERICRNVEMSKCRTVHSIPHR